MRSLIPLLQILNDFSEILIKDDMYDIGQLSTVTHPSSFHHYQWGTLIKGLTDTAIQLITFSSRMLESQESQAQSLSAIRQMMAEAEYHRNQEKVQRVQLMLQYWNFLKHPPSTSSEGGQEQEQGQEYYTIDGDRKIDWNNAVYKGDLRNIVVNKDFQEAVRYEYWRRQQQQQQANNSNKRPMIVQPRMLPATLPRPPKAPRIS